MEDHGFDGRPFLTPFVERVLVLDGAMGTMLSSSATSRPTISAGLRLKAAMKTW